MRRTWVLVSCTVVAAAVAVTVAAEDPAGNTPSLEYRPPRPVVPEPRAPKPSTPVAIFEDSFGGFGISEGSFDGPVDVAFGAGGDESLYVLDKGNNRVQLFDSFENLNVAWGSRGSRENEFEFRDPEALALRGGVLYVVDTGNHRIQKFAWGGTTPARAPKRRDGMMLRPLAQLGGFGSRNEEFRYPRDLTFCPDGSLWVLDAGNERVVEYGVAGSAKEGYVQQWGSPFGGQGGDFTRLVSIACTDEPLAPIYLLSADCLVQQFERGGRRVASWKAVAPESGVCEGGRIEADNREDVLYLLDAGNSLFLKYARNGRYLAGKGGAARPFRAPRGLAVNEDRKEFAVADTGNDVVQKFTLR